MDFGAATLSSIGSMGAAAVSSVTPSGRIWYTDSV